MVFFIGLVLALVCAWLVCRFIKKFWKPFFTRFMPKFGKVMIWITVILSILAVGFVIYSYTELYVCKKETLVKIRLLPSDIISDIKEHGVKRWWRRVKNDGKFYEEQYAEEAKKKALTEATEAEKKERERRGLLSYKESYNIFQRILLYPLFKIYDLFP